MKRLGLCGALVLASVAFATTLLAVDVPRLTRDADLIVMGTVRSSSARFSGDGRRVVTDTEIEVSQALKGTPDGAKVTVMQPGGVVGSVGQRVEGTAGFRVGEEVVVFLNRRGNTRFDVTAMAQGKFRVERSSDGSAVYAVPEVASVRRVDPLTQNETASLLKSMPLQQLKAAIAAALATPVTPAPTQRKAQ